MGTSAAKVRKITESSKYIPVFSFKRFVIRSREIVICYGLGNYKSSALIGRTFFNDGFQIRRDGTKKS